MKSIISAIFIIFSCSAFSYVHNQTSNGVAIHWPSTSSIIDIYFNSQNRLLLDEAAIQLIGLNSTNQWNGHSRIALRKNATTVKNQVGLNEVYFSSDPVFFGGAGVKGVTQVSYRQDTGEILEADILIDDTMSIFSTTMTDINFLGNVFTHELGHCYMYSLRNVDTVAENTNQFFRLFSEGFAEYIKYLVLGEKSLELD